MLIARFIRFLLLWPKWIKYLDQWTISHLGCTLRKFSSSVGELASSSDYNTTGNGFVYINVALNILQSTICLINTTTERPNFSSLQNVRQIFPYTVPLVDICTCSWKTIEFISMSASESATSFAWYSRTLRMRRGPNTNICTPNEIWRLPWIIKDPKEFEFYRNDEPLV
jgi:hypothetical protein